MIIDEQERLLMSRIEERDRGSISVVAVLLVFSAALLTMSLGGLNRLEHQLVDRDMLHRRLALMAEQAALAEYKRLSREPGLLQRVLEEHRPMTTTGYSGETDSGHCQVFVGEEANLVIIWAVAEGRDTKAQVSFLLEFDESRNRFMLKGMF